MSAPAKVTLRHGDDRFARLRGYFAKPDAAWPELDAALRAEIAESTAQARSVSLDRVRERIGKPRP